MLSFPIRACLVLMIFFYIFMPAPMVLAESQQSEPPSGLANSPEVLRDPLFKPLIERYILDELKALRQEQQGLQANVTQRLTDTQLEVSDRALNYTTSTVNNVFFIITAAASILVLVGWNSLRDVRTKIEEIVENRVSQISNEYEQRLSALEQRLKDRTEEIFAAHEKIAKTNTTHSLWMRGGLESNPQARIDIYDEILRINPKDVEALAYKADVVLELNEPQWALNLCDRALTIDSHYANAYWQRACAYATLKQPDLAVKDIQMAIKLSATFLSMVQMEQAFEPIRECDIFKHFLDGLSIETPTLSNAVK